MFLRQRGRKILLLHCVREPGGRVRQLRLFHFEGPEDLGHWLQETQWSELAARVHAIAPELQLDFEGLRERARAIVQTAPSEAGGTLGAPTSSRPVRSTPRSRQPVVPDPVGALRLSARNLAHQILCQNADCARLAARELQELAQLIRSSLGRVRPKQARRAATQADELLRTGSLGSARRWLRKAVRCQPFEPNLRVQLGDCCPPERATRTYQEAVELAFHQLPLGRRVFEPGEPEARPYYHALGRLSENQERLGLLEEARQTLRRRLDAFRDAESQVALGWVLHRLDRWQEARIHYQRAVDHPVALFNLAQGHLARGQVELALTPLLRGLTLNARVARYADRPHPGSPWEVAPETPTPEYAHWYWRRFGAPWTSAQKEFIRLIERQPLVRYRLRQIFEKRFRPRVVLFPRHLVALRRRLDGLHPLVANW